MRIWTSFQHINQLSNRIFSFFWNQYVNLPKNATAKPSETQPTRPRLKYPIALVTVVGMPPNNAQPRSQMAKLTRAQLSGCRSCLVFHGYHDHQDIEDDACRGQHAHGDGQDSVTSLRQDPWIDWVERRWVSILDVLFHFTLFKLLFLVSVTGSSETSDLISKEKKTQKKTKLKMKIEFQKGREIFFFTDSACLLL